MATFVLAYYLLFYVLCRATFFIHMDVIHHLIFLFRADENKMRKLSPSRESFFI